MKKIFKTLALVAAAAAVLASCQKPEIENPVKEEGSKVVYFGTQVNDMTKASITTEDDANFTAAWEDEDALTIAGFDSGSFIADFPAVWNSTKAAFAASGDVDAFFDEPYDFIGVYPQPVDDEIDFGSERTQNGNNYTGKYDVMLSKATTLTLTEGETVILPMDRQTAIAYFHLTSSLPSSEKVIAAKLSTNEKIAGHFTFKNGVIAEVKDSKSIYLTFTNAPSADDLKLWFNVFPGTYTGLKLEVETTTRYLCIENSNTVTYEAGKLYKVAADVASSKYVEKEKTVTKSISNVVSENSYTVSSGSTINTKVTSIDLDDVINVSVGVKQGATGNTGSFWGTSPSIDWRLYQSDEPKITVSAKKGGTIKTVKLTYSNSNTGVINTTGCGQSIAAENQIKSNTAYDVDAASVDYYVGNTSTKTTGQARITTIEVKYTLGIGGNTPGGDTPGGDTPGGDIPGGESTWTKVSDISTLKAGDEITFVSSVAVDYNNESAVKQNGIVAISALNSNGNNWIGIGVTVEDDVLTTSDGVFSFTLHATGNQSYPWAFKFVENGITKYIYAGNTSTSSAKNYLKVTDTLVDAAKFSIAISDGVATITANGGAGRNVLKISGNYQNTQQNDKWNTPIFNCYASSSSMTAPSIYKKQ